MANASIDDSGARTLIAVSNVDGKTPVKLYADPVTHRLLVDIVGGVGTVTSVSVATINGFAGTVNNPTTTPEIEIETTVTGILLGDGLGVSAAVAGTDYVDPGPITASGLTMATARLLGRSTASTGAIEEIIIGSGLDLTAGELTATGGGGTPGGANTQVQYNDNGAFGGITGVTSNGTAMTFGSLALVAPNIVNTGTLTLPTATDTLVGRDTTDTLTNKTLTAPIMTAPVLGTPASGTLTNTTGFPVANLAGAGAGVLTFLATPSSANLATAVTDETGSGALVFGTTPTMTTSMLFTSGFVMNWNSSNVVITHSSGILTMGTGEMRISNVGTDTASVVTVGGSQTLTSKGLTSPAVTTATFTGAQLLNEGASIALDPSLSADGTWTGITMTATAGYTQAFGDLVYLDPTDSRWEAADANSASGADGDSRGMLGMVVVAGTDGNACTILLQGVIRADAKFPSFTVNNPIYVSETAGSVTQTQPTTTDVVIRILGAALTADSMYFDPDKTWITHT